MSEHGPASIAVVGLGGVFPGARDLESFQRNLLDGADAVREVPPGRWVVDPRDAFDPTPGLDRCYCTAGCFVEDFEFDPGGLNLDSIDGLDPVYQLALHAGRDAWAEVATGSIDRDRVGVVLAAIALPTDSSSEITQAVLGRSFEESLTGGDKSWPRGANPLPSPLNARVTARPGSLLASALGLGGGSFTLDAACASSLYAVKLACDALRAGRVDAMLAGGVSRPESLYTQMGFSQLRALSLSGVCRPFDARADGLIVGEGAGVVALKRLEDAVGDGDRVYAVIRGWGLSNDIAGSLLAADSEGQLRAMKQAYDHAGWRPSDIDVIECHGTGTPLGDAAEIRSMRSLWGDSGWSAGQCAIGSVKSNIGHLLTAAGAAGLIKMVLALRDQKIPPSLNFDHASPDAGLEGSPFAVPSSAETWHRRDERTLRRAGVSGFGFGGINAHLLIEEYDAAVSSRSRKVSVRGAGLDAQAIAVVGMDARFGRVQSLRAFCELVLSGRSAIGARPADRWSGCDEWMRAVLGGCDLPGAYIESMSVEIGAFRLPPNEICEVLPQQLLMLVSVAEALRDAGIERDGRSERSSVIVGMSLDLNTTNFHHRWALLPQARDWARSLGLDLSEAELAEWVEHLRTESGPALTPGRVVGALGNIIASRIAREFAFGGPSFAVSSEEASGVHALEIGRRALQLGEIDLAVVGAVDLPGDVRSVLACDAQRRYSRCGRVLPFDALADGPVPGEGAVTLVLKRLSDATEAGDRVYATLDGIGFAGGGLNGVPEAAICGRAIRRAYDDAGVSTSSVGYIEANGSGDPTEDRIEADALTTLFDGSNVGRCPIGSIKPNIGHTGAASGLASIAKACLCLYQEIIPPLVRSTDVARSALSVEEVFDVPTRAHYWLRDRSTETRRAGVNVLTCDGGAAHVVLSGCDVSTEKPTVELLQPLGARSGSVFGVSGDDVGSLVRGLELLEALANEPAGGVERMARVWFERGRRDGRLGVAIVASDGSSLRGAVSRALHHLRSEPAMAMRRDGVYFSPAPFGPKAKVAFVFPGSGSHYPGMGDGAFAHWPEVLRSLDRESEWLRSQMVLGAGDEDVRRVILAQVSHGVAMAELLRRLGIEPSAAIGYSLGETTAMFALRAWRDRDEMYNRMLGSPLFASELAGRCEAARRTWALGDDESVDWCVVVVNRPAAIVRDVLAELTNVYLLIVNTPDECVIGGSRRNVDRVVKSLGCESVAVRGASTVHCPIAATVADAYREFHLLPTTAPSDVAFYSAAWAKRFDVTRESAADSIVEQALKGFDYTAVVERAYADGVRVFVEPGPGATCTRMIGRILSGRPHTTAFASAEGKDEPTTILNLVATMYAERVIDDLAPLYGHETRVRGHELPTSSDARRKSVVVRTGRQAPCPKLPPPKKQPIEHVDVPVAAPVGDQTDDLAGDVVRAAAATASAHETFLRFSKDAMTGMGQALALEARLLEHVPLGSVMPAAVATPPQRSVAYDRDMCMEFAIGSAAKVLGPEFAPLDSYRVRVRLPDEPLMLVDRIVSVEGVKSSLTSGTIVTEHDVLPGAWYLDGDRAPVCIAVEAGQADLFLCAYLGIDQAVQGTRAYRLLDAKVTFHRHLPLPGETVRYEIHIDRFVRQDETYLFFFSFEGTVAGQPVLTMTDGCAGFFTEQEVADSGGILQTAEDLAPAAGVKPSDWRELVPMAVASYDEQQLDALRQGDLAACFGHAFANLGLSNPLRVPGGRMRLVHRVTQLDPAGGRYGMGMIRAEADIHPDDWFLTCHFVDDMVMPGTLMYECCTHTLRIFLLRMGWVAEQSRVCYEPVEGVSSKLRCRGPVTTSTKVVTYEVQIKEIGYGPEPYVIADALMYADGHKVVQFTDMSLKMTGASRDEIERLWSSSQSPRVEPIGDQLVIAESKPPIFDDARILAFAVGKPSDAFGDKYKVFDGDRRIARLPGPPYKFLDRITEVHAQPWELTPGGWIEAQYDVPPDEWCFRANRQRSMPFAVILEIALQPCGWLAAYLGSALQSDIDMSFRNLGGTARLYEEIFPEAGVLTTRVRINKISAAGGMLIESFNMQIWQAGRIVYDGETSFGFFSKKALNQQIGIRDAAERLYVPTEAELSRSRGLAVDRVAPLTPDDDAFEPGSSACMPASAMLMLDSVDMFVADGGPDGLGFIRGSLKVDPSAWFFAAHFYQDPVVPGSLGLESYLQLLKLIAIDRWGDRVCSTHRFCPILVGPEHRWIYRGQIVPTNGVVEVDAVVTEIRDDPTPTIVGNGFLKVDGRPIYEMRDFGISLVPVD
jgi:acyl transferase domain-containing protein/3-hydroxymyristoyl/3-hydroxydecanoyl-(acyl carrier protein) dehydratase